MTALLNTSNNTLPKMMRLFKIALACAIKELPRGYRTIFLLHEVEGYEHRDRTDARLLRRKLEVTTAQSQVANSPGVGTFGESESATIRVGGSRMEPAGPLFAKWGLSIERSVGMQPTSGILRN